jgi:hypothetical protein
MIKPFWKLLFFLIPISQLTAQDFPLIDFPISDWTSKPNTWNAIGSINIHPFENKIDISKGNMELYSAKAGSEIKSNKTFGSFKLEFEILQNEETEAVFSIGDGLMISLSNSSASKMPELGSVKTSAGAWNKVAQDVCKHTGLWQKIELLYKASDGKMPAVLEKVKINGVLQVQNFVSQNRNEKPNQIGFTLNKGVLALRNVKYAFLGNAKPISISNLSYVLQETEGWDHTFEVKKTPPIHGISDELSFRIPNDYKEFILTYSGNMKVDKDGLYAFTLDYQGVSDLQIDGKKVAGSNEFTYRIPETQLIDLKEGMHTFEYKYQRIWWPPGFGIFISGSNFGAYALHSSNNLSVPKVVGGIYENMDGNRTRVIRSFMNYKGVKRTSVMTVGTPEKRHYSIDLNDGSMLYAWKGDFADVTEMWHERGEPQLIEALGQIISMSGKPNFFQNEKDVTVFKEYFLDTKGIPTYLHALNGQKVSRKLEPLKNGFEITLSTENKDIKYLLAEDQNIEKLSESLFRTSDYYIQLSHPSSAKISIKNGLMQLSGSASAIESYTLIW